VPFGPSADPAPALSIAASIPPLQRLASRRSGGSAFAGP
jgi:hypothetical protein